MLKKLIYPNLKYLNTSYAFFVLFFRSYAYLRLFVPRFLILYISFVMLVSIDLVDGVIIMKLMFLIVKVDNV